MLIQVTNGATGIPRVVAGEGVRFDDGQWFLPGEPGFDNGPLTAFMQTQPVGSKFDIIGRSPTAKNPQSIAEKEADDARKAAEEAEQLQMQVRERERMAQDIADRHLRETNPEEWERTRARREVESRFAAEFEKADKLGLDPVSLDSLQLLKERALLAVDIAEAAEAESEK